MEENERLDFEYEECKHVHKDSPENSICEDCYFKKDKEVENGK